MIVAYSWGTKIKREGNTGVKCCQNCRHSVQTSLYKEIGYVNLFFILPIVRYTKVRGILCEHCGDLVPLSRHQYKEIKGNGLLP